MKILHPKPPGPRFSKAAPTIGERLVLFAACSDWASIGQPLPFCCRWWKTFVGVKNKNASPSMANESNQKQEMERRRMERSGEESFPSPSVTVFPQLVPYVLPTCAILPVKKMFLNAVGNKTPRILIFFVVKRSIENFFLQPLWLIVQSTVALQRKKENFTYHATFRKECKRNTFKKSYKNISSDKHGPLNLMILM